MMVGYSFEDSISAWLFYFIDTFDTFGTQELENDIDEGMQDLEIELPRVLILTLDPSDWEDGDLDFEAEYFRHSFKKHQALMSNLHSRLGGKANVIDVTSPTDLLKYLTLPPSSTSPATGNKIKAIVLLNESFTNTKTSRALAEALSKYVQGGGIAIITHDGLGAAEEEAESYLIYALGLPWKIAENEDHQEEFQVYLNLQHHQASIIPDTSPTFPSKLNVCPGELGMSSNLLLADQSSCLYTTEQKSVVCTNCSAVVHLDSSGPHSSGEYELAYDVVQSPVILDKRGSGYWGYVGVNCADFDAENIKRWSGIIAEMCQL